MNEIEKLINKYKERKSKLKSNGDICIKETQDPFAKIAIKTFDLIFSEFIKDLQKLNKPDVIKSVGFCNEGYNRENCPTIRTNCKDCDSMIKPTVL
jgi:hypothetical protein